MTDFGSATWFDALAARVALVVLDGEPVVLEQRITDAGPDDLPSWHLELGSESHARLGPAARPDVVLSCDRATGAALAGGTVNAQRAISEGRLRVGGDLRALVRVAPLVAGVLDARRGS